jgi:hypothetical protein
MRLVLAVKAYEPPAGNAARAKVEEGRSVWTAIAEHVPGHASQQCRYCPSPLAMHTQWHLGGLGAAYKSCSSIVANDDS